MDYQNFDLVVQVRDEATRTYSVLADGAADVSALDTFSLQGDWDALQALADQVGRQATLARSAAGPATLEHVAAGAGDTVPTDMGLSLETVADLVAQPGGVRNFAPEVEGWEGEGAAIELARALGQQLHDAVFTEKVQAALRHARQALPAGTGLRLRLRLEGAPELHRLPWEYLHDGEGFLALQAGVPVVRHVEEAAPSPPLQVDGALRVLVVVSSPEDEASLDVDAEVSRLRAVLAEPVDAGRLALDVLEDGRWSTLEAALTPGEGQPTYHVLHFIGHGAADPQGGGRLYFEGEDGGAVAQDAEGLTALLMNHPTLRLVVLNACQGATSDELDARSSVAAQLVGRPAPAVVAMQYSITDRAALDFSRAFYGALALGNPVDTALGLARAAEFRRLADGDAPRGVEWGTPVLYLRARDGRLFAPAESPPRFGPKAWLLAGLAALALAGAAAAAFAARTPYYRDQDGDGLGQGDAMVAWSPPAGHVANRDDCDDGDDAVTGKQPYYADHDGDGVGAGVAVGEACTVPDGRAPTNTDCDDRRADVRPGAAERCDAVDHDCDGAPLNGVTPPTWYADADGDGYGDPTKATQACTAPAGHVAQAGDCDDRDRAIHPQAEEQCDAVDHNCDGSTDAGVTYHDWFLDRDGDGVGVDRRRRRDCKQPPGYAAKPGDCDDRAPTTHPGAAEACDGRDQDCDGRVDEGLPTQTWYRDADLDGHGDARTTQAECRQPPGYVSKGDDCNDRDRRVHARNRCNQCAALPAEACNGRDDDCDGKTDEGTKNRCGGCGAVPRERCNGRDDDCDGRVDEGGPGGGTNAWQEGPKSNGSYDHNCDGRTERRWTANGGVCRCKKSFLGTALMEGEDKTPGWVKGVPKCGQVGSWGKSCNYQVSAVRCEWRTEQRRQACR